MSEVIESDVKCITAGNLTNDLTIGCGIHWCGDIRNGVAFRFGNRGSWVLSYEDLKTAYELATEIRASFDAAGGESR